MLCKSTINDGGLALNLSITSINYGRLVLSLSMTSINNGRLTLSLSMTSINNGGLVKTFEVSFGKPMLGELVQCFHLYF